MTNQAQDLELSVSSLRKEFHIRGGVASETLTAVDGVSFEVAAGETVALVGESGSGKSTVARCVTRLVEPTSGVVRLGSVEVTSVPRRQLPRVYRDLQMVFQDPNGSLNPRMTARAAIEEPLRLHSRALRYGPRVTAEPTRHRRGAAPATSRPLPASAERRAATTGGHCPGARCRPEDHRFGRADRFARRVDASSYSAAPRDDPALETARLPLHQPRPRDGPALCGPSPRHVPRRNSRVGFSA